MLKNKIRIKHVTLNWLVCLIFRKTVSKALSRNHFRTNNQQSCVLSTCFIFLCSFNAIYSVEILKSRGVCYVFNNVASRITRLTYSFIFLKWKRYIKGIEKNLAFPGNMCVLLRSGCKFKTICLDLKCE